MLAPRVTPILRRRHHCYSPAKVRGCPRFCSAFVSLASISLRHGAFGNVRVWCLIEGGSLGAHLRADWSRCLAADCSSGGASRRRLGTGRFSRQCFSGLLIAVNGSRICCCAIGRALPSESGLPSRTTAFHYLGSWLLKQCFRFYVGLPKGPAVDPVFQQRCCSISLSHDR